MFANSLLLLFLLFSCSKAKQDTRIPFENASELEKEKGAPTRIETLSTDPTEEGVKSPVSKNTKDTGKANLWCYRDGECFQIENESVRVRFRAPKGIERSFSYWQEEWKELPLKSRVMNNSDPHAPVEILQISTRNRGVLVKAETLEVIRVIDFIP